MNTGSILIESLSSMAKNKVRTALSMLGIVIGVASVITMVAMGEGTKADVEREIAAMGDDWMFIGYWGQMRSGVRGADVQIPALQTLEEAESLMTQCSAIRAATPTNRIGMQAISSYNNYNASCMGAWPQIFDIRRWRAERGRLFDERDEDTQAKVCVIGHTTARELFGNIDPVGQTIRVNKVPFEIIGLLQSKGRSSDGRDYDDVLLFPYSSFQRRLAGIERSQTLLAATKPGYTTEQAKEQVRVFLRERHRLQPNEPDDFRMYDTSESANLKSAASESFGTLLLGIASVSLIVGGVGIMNIMLVSVTERTREIGLRMALGAGEGTILAQFLTEAVLMCTLGGLVGLGVGVGVSRFLEQSENWTMIIPGWALAIAAGFASAVGIFFGFYPAWRASRLDPIEALRYE